MKEWPGLSEELGRKALEVLNARVFEHSVEASLSDRELRIVVDVLVDTIQGLAPMEVTDIIYQVRKELEKCSSTAP